MIGNFLFKLKTQKQSFLIPSPNLFILTEPIVVGCSCLSRPILDKATGALTLLRNGSTTQHRCIETQLMPSERARRDQQNMRDHFHIKLFHQGVICITKCPH